METYLIVDEARGRRPFAFEIETAYLEPGTVTRLLKDVVGVSHVRERKPFAPNDEIHAEFRYMNRNYVVWEPYGENTRYWIGPRAPEAGAVSVEPIERAFRQYRPPLHRKVIGDILSLPLVRHLVGA